MVVLASVTSCKDYCNSFLYGIVDYGINRLQRIQNGATRVLTNNGKCSHVKIILQNFHWLPVKQSFYYQHMSVFMVWHQNICMIFSWSINQADFSAHPVRYYWICQLLGSSVMVTVHLVFQAHVCGTGCQKAQKCNVSSEVSSEVTFLAFSLYLSA